LECISGSGEAGEDGETMGSPCLHVSISPGLMAPPLVLLVPMVSVFRLHGARLVFIVSVSVSVFMVFVFVVSIFMLSMIIISIIYIILSP
jgi:hypothetical protein